MTKETNRESALIDVRGIVQGVGFRPFIYQLASQHGLSGWVCNTSEGVTIDVEGSPASLDDFIADIPLCKPPRSAIETLIHSRKQPEGYTSFTIRESLPEPGKYQLISPDIATCPECLKEIFDPSNRRYRYPFTNCTNCGPRFTIIEDIPYDRPLTTMKMFAMCPECKSEYDNPQDRRFHAQPNACPVCGPSLLLLDDTGNPVITEDPIQTASELLKDGKILAVKGLGGFLLACDATSENTVNLLRSRKRRPSKPFAVMVSSIEEAKRHCRITDEEEKLLVSPAAPIVLAGWKRDSTICPAIAPNNNYLGIMLPYTPLHHLLLNEAGLPLVMTSGNLSEEPIAKDNDEALKRLSGIADFFLVHNRDIYARYDDSVMVVQDKQPRMVRRARGTAPYPVKLSSPMPSVLACGAELKNTFCLTRDNYAFVSQHIGDMENLETLDHYETTLKLYKKLFRIEPELIAYDMHPDYLPTKYALDTISAHPELISVPVQHHHAHIASCLADNGLADPVIGVSFDGTGYGTDGKIWGGEFMVADFKGFRRVAHLQYLPLPGGEAAIRKPYRIAAGYLYALFGKSALEHDFSRFLQIHPEELAVIESQVDKKINAPLNSSCGRLFDCVSALLGIRNEVDYEAQAAIELEMIADRALLETKNYPFTIERSGETDVLNLEETFTGILEDLQQGVEKATIAAKFHNTVASMIFVLCTMISSATGIRDVALSGGVFQNRLLLTQAVRRLKFAGFNVFTHRQVPTNDGGISLGQAVIAGCSR